jgi:hypothetical protein
VSQYACRIRECYRSRRAQRHLQNSENPIAPGQTAALGGPSDLGEPTPTVIGSTGCLGRVAEWQTRWLQVPVSFGTWGFKSPFAHIDQFD